MDRLSRDARWNLSLAVLVLSSALVVRLTGTAWAWIGAVLGEAAVLAAVLLPSRPLIRRLLRPSYDPLDTEAYEAQRQAELSQLAGIWAATGKAGSMSRHPAGRDLPEGRAA